MSKSPSPPSFLAELDAPVPCSTRPALFHPPDDGYIGHGVRGLARVRDAFTLCGGCPVMSACRQWARENREVGIWGGETEAQRHAARRGSEERKKGRRVSAAAREAGDTAVARPRLTAREEEVLFALYGGLRREEVPASLGRSPKSVSRSIYGLRKKLDTDELGVLGEAGRRGLTRSPYRSAG